MTGPQRVAVITELAAIIGDYELEHPTRVAIDGMSAAGKTTIAGELATALVASGHSVVQLTMDGYHHPRAHRYRQGRLSGNGYYEDAFDVCSFATSVLVPLGPGGNGRYRERIHDLETDADIDEPTVEAPEGAVLIVDGSFLQRPELAAHWDICIFVDTSFEVALRRGLDRDSGSLGGHDAAALAYEARYHAAARRYLEEVRPRQRATIVLGNDDLAAPVLHVIPHQPARNSG